MKHNEAVPKPQLQQRIALFTSAAAAAALTLSMHPAIADEAPVLPDPAPIEQDSIVQPVAVDSHANKLAEVAAAVQRDFVEGQYYVTGKLTPSLYEPDALFIDPTTRVQGVEKYTAAVAALFDPAESRADLISIREDPKDDVIVLRWRLEGKLNLLGGLPIKPYTGTTRYVLDAAGLISKHEETWDISAADAFISTFLPGFGAPPAPPVSSTP